jgi:hypothetical protein
MEAMRVRRQRRRHPPDARGGHLGSAATSSGFAVSLWEEGRAHPTCDYHTGSPHAEQPELVVEFRGASAQGAILPHRILWTCFSQPDFQHLVRVPSPTASRGAYRWPRPSPTSYLCPLPPASGECYQHPALRQPPAEYSSPGRRLSRAVIPSPRREAPRNPHEVGGVGGRSAAISKRPPHSPGPGMSRGPRRQGPRNRPHRNRGCRPPSSGAHRNRGREGRSKSSSPKWGVPIPLVGSSPKSGSGGAVEIVITEMGGADPPLVGEGPERHRPRARGLPPRCARQRRTICPPPGSVWRGGSVP